MKRRLRYIIASGVAVLLLLATLGTAVLAATESKNDPLHFGILGMGSNETMAASVLFERLFGEAPTANEAAYLDRLSGITFTYNDAIPDSVVSTSYNGEAGTLELSMPPYSFVAANGATVSWIPAKATLDGQTVAFSLDDAGKYSAVLSGLFHSDDFDVKISLAAEIEVPAESVDALLTGSYEAAEDSLAIIRAYEAEYAVWYAANEKFLAYQAYCDAVAAYQQYTADLKQYNEVDLPAYEDYLEILAVQKLYDDWEHYKDYDEYLKTGVVKRQEYLAYLAKVEKVTAKLAVLENLFATDSNGWMFYASLMGGTVDMVLQEQDKLEFAGVAKEDILSAGASTAKLKELLSAYDALRNAEYASEHVRLTTLYGFYTEHFSELKEHLCNLYGKLHTFYNIGTVRSAIILKGKLERYRQFTGILYVTRTCIDDSMTRDSGWFLQDGKSCPLHEIVDAENILPDTNTADPTGVSMPAEEVPAVEEITPIDKPSQPQPQTRPNPAYMAEPVKPTPVEDPDADPAKIPPYAESVGTAPEAPEMDATRKALAEDLRAGTLKKREPLGTAKRLVLTTEMNCPISINNEMTVTFYAADGKTVLDRQKLEYGSRIIYRGADPAREPDAQYVYTFSAWVLSDGTAPEMVLTKNLSLYAYYHTSVRYYTVTWVLDGEIKTDSLAYGDMPKCPFVTEREDDDSYTYEFSGWDREITPVTGDVTYTGTINRHERLYTVTWQMGETAVSEKLPYGALPTAPTVNERAPDSYLYEFLSWSPAISSVRGDMTYIAEYRRTPLAVSDDGGVQEVSHTEAAVVIRAVSDAIDIREAALYAKAIGKCLQIDWKGFSVMIEPQNLSILIDSFCRKICATLRGDTSSGNVYDVMLCNSAGHEVELALPMTVASIGKSGLYLPSADAWVRQEGAVACVGAFSVRVCESYAVSVDPTENCYISELPTQIEAGSVVDLKIGCTFGYHVSAARVTRADGSEVEVRDLCFVMPAEAVKVELTVTKIIYHVTFLSDGKVLSEADYYLGDDIKYPESPQKESDEIYHYTFSRWSNDLTVAMGDDHAPVFEAIFTATERNGVDPFISTENNEWIITVALPIFLGLLLAGGGVFVFLRLRRKKKTAKPDKAVSEDAADMPTEPEQACEADDSPKQ